MTMSKISVLCGLCLMLFGCNTGNSVDDDTLSVYVVQEMVRPPGEQHKFVRGAFSRVVLAIENASDDVIVLRGCSVSQQLPDIDRWYGSLYGSVSDKPLEDEWVYNEMVQQLSDPVFATGVIPPNDRLKVVRWLCLTEEEIEIDVSYHRLREEDALENLYVETYVDGQFNMERIFKHPNSPFADANSRADTNWQVVIFPRAGEFPVDRTSLACRVSLQEPPLSISAVRNTFHDKIQDAVYWKGQGKWVVRTNRGVFLVDDQSNSRLGDVDLLCFAVIESSFKAVDCILPLKGYEDFDAQPPRIEGPGYFNAGVTKIAHADIIRLLEAARDNNHSVTVLSYDANGLGSKFYLLIGEFDAVARRKIAER